MGGGFVRVFMSVTSASQRVASQSAPTSPTSHVLCTYISRSTGNPFFLLYHDRKTVHSAFLWSGEHFGYKYLQPKIGLSFQGGGEKQDFWKPLKITINLQKRSFMITENWAENTPEITIISLPKRQEKGLLENFQYICFPKITKSWNFNQYFSPKCTILLNNLLFFFIIIMFVFILFFQVLLKRFYVLLIVLILVYIGGRCWSSNGQERGFVNWEITNSNHAYGLLFICQKKNC